MPDAERTGSNSSRDTVAKFATANAIKVSHNIDAHKHAASLSEPPAGQHLCALAASVMTYLVVFTFGKHRFDHIEGMIFLLCYVAYTAHLLLR